MDSASPIGTKTGARQQPVRRRIVLTLCLLAAIGLAVGSCVYVICGVTLPNVYRGNCANNLRNVGMACTQYAKEHDGQFPDSFGDVLLHRSELISTSVLTCPTAPNTLATGPTTRAVVDSLNAGGHVSYVYTGRGATLSDANLAARVIAHDRLANHNHRGINVLYGDVHVEWLEAPAARRLIAELEAGHNPPR